MTYNLGEVMLSDFESFNSLMRHGKWNAAANDLIYGTSWCSEVGKRCERNVDLIKSCVASQEKHIDRSQFAKQKNKFCESDMK